ncbi:LuxR C-terminal-related transcriptional regulator [Streptomyces sp. NPDC049687]|uniref:LuxR C-terminal-related transcriptional regulator n=1 Tax=Streptomyces sp. NPDC049687 TaxID=3365596 RepID=UPI0037B1FE0B
MKENDLAISACECGNTDFPCKEGISMYRHALGRGGIPRHDTPRCLRALQLVTEDVRSPDTFTPVPPHVAAFGVLHPIEEAILKQQQDLRSAMAALSVFEDEYTSARSREEPLLTLLSGDHVITRALEAAVGNCTHELLTAQPGGGREPHLLAEALHRDLGNLKRGVRQRTIYQHSVRSHQPTLAYVERVTEAGAEVRTLAEVFERVIICDQEVAFIPVSPERSNAALQIRDPAVVRFLARWFENAWSRSLAVDPVRSPPKSAVVMSDVRRTILQAVIAGETDDSIARRLGMSRRSVVEHVRKVSQELGSSSRAQLGYLLATSGLLD